MLETALILPILLLLGFGAVEFGHFFYIKHNLQGAAREGARAAIVPGCSNTDVTNAVGNVMTSAGISSGKYTVTTSPADVSTAASGSNVTITVTCTWGNVGLRPMSLISSSKSLAGQVVMRRE